MKGINLVIKFRMGLNRNLHLLGIRCLPKVHKKVMFKKY